MHLQLLAVVRVFDLGDIAVGHDVRVVRGFEQGVDRRRDDVGGAQLRDPVVARPGREQFVEQTQQIVALFIGFDHHPQVAEALALEPLVKSERGHRIAPGTVAVELEHQRFVVLVVEAGADARALRRAGDAGLAGDGSRSRHIAVVRVQPISRIWPPSSEQSTFWPMPVARAWVRAASAPPNARIAQVSSATETMPVRSCCPGWNRPARCRPAPAPSSPCRAGGVSAPWGRSPTPRHRRASG